MKLGDAADWLRAEPQRMQGEFVLVLAAGEPKTPQRGRTPIACSRCCSKPLAPSEAARLAAKHHRRLQARALPEGLGPSEVKSNRWTGSR